MDTTPASGRLHGAKRLHFLEVVAPLPLVPTLSRLRVGAGAALAQPPRGRTLSCVPWRRLRGKRPLRVAVVSLRGAGKTNSPHTPAHLCTPLLLPTRSTS